MLKNNGCTYIYIRAIFANCEKSNKIGQNQKSACTGNVRAKPILYGKCPPPSKNPYLSMFFRGAYFLRKERFMKFVSVDTGEIIDIASYKTMKQLTTEENDLKDSNQRKKLYEVIRKELGGFYFLQYNKLLDTLENDTATAFRFLYLCSYSDKDGYIYTYNSKKCSSYTDFTFIFDRTRSTVTDFVKAMEKHNLVYKIDDCYVVNTQYYSMNINSQTFKTNSIRTFNNAIRELYKNSNPKEHSLIGEILKLVPYINISNNILCWNNEAVRSDDIIPLTLAEIRGILRPNSDYGRKLTNKIEKLTIKGEPVFGKFDSLGNPHYVINPRLFYRGNNIDQLKGLIDQFDVTKNKRK